MDFSHFDTRKYPTVSAQEGYGEWAMTYEDIVLDEMDLRLFERIETVDWAGAGEVIDLACGTGRVGVWLKRKGVETLDGLDLTPQMMERAQAKGVYRTLYPGDVLDMPLPDAAYDLATISLADEHLETIRPLYSETARITRAGGRFVIVGYHPYFLMGGVPTHYNSASGPLTIRSYVHLTSDHVLAARAAGWSLVEMYEGLIDDAWIARKPKWRVYENRPISFAMVWQKASQ